MTDLDRLKDTFDAMGIEYVMNQEPPLYTGGLPYDGSVIHALPTREIDGGDPNAYFCFDRAGKFVKHGVSG